MNYISFFDFTLGVLPPFWARWLPRLTAVGFCVFMTLILLASFAPASTGDIEDTLGFDDKLAHFLAYAAVMGCGMWAAHSSHLRMRLFIALVGFSAFIELGQPLLADGREASIGDTFANILGLCFGVGLGNWFLAGLRRLLPRGRS